MSLDCCADYSNRPGDPHRHFRHRWPVGEIDSPEDVTLYEYMVRGELLLEDALPGRDRRPDEYDLSPVP